MPQVRLYGVISILIVSSIALIWIISLWLKTETLKKFIIYMVSFSAWALFGDVFIHLIPETVKMWFTAMSGLYVLTWIIFGLITEKVIHRNHCHMPITKHHVHHFAIMNLIGDFVHNMLDGLIIWASYLVNIPTWIATTIAVILHEIPQEIWDFGVLIHWWYSKKKAILMNFLTALSAFVWLAIALIWADKIWNIQWFLIPFAAGSFIYIAGSDLIPELHKQNKTWQAILQILTFIAWIAIMSLLLFLE